VVVPVGGSMLEQSFISAVLEQFLIPAVLHFCLAYQFGRFPTIAYIFQFFILVALSIEHKYRLSTSDP
jgi:hypothetical protein